MTKNFFSNYFLFPLLSIYPISILIGNLAINLNIFLISILFILGFILKKFNFKNQSLSIYLILFFLLTLIVNLYFSKNIILSYPRVIKIFFIIFFISSFAWLLNNSEKKNLDLLYKIWSIIFIFVIFDLIIEFINGKNILGYSSIFPGKRLASFTGKESVIGNYYLGFVLIFLSVSRLYIKNKYLNLILVLFLILVSFLIGERSNFIRTLIICVAYTFIIYEAKIWIKTISFLFLVVSFIAILNFNQNYKTRYYNEIALIFESGLTSYLENTNYGAHRNVAYEIFKDNPVFGVGIKNFRIESANSKYDNLNHKQNHLRVSTHPHELYYEFISETGLVGLLSFVIFIFLSLYFSIKNYLKYQNIFQLSAILFIISAILPVLPTGSFLSTYSSSIFWLNYAIMMGYNRVIKY